MCSACLHERSVMPFPSRFLDETFFDAISEHVIPKPQLCDKIVSITAFGHKFVGYPLQIENKK